MACHSNISPTNRFQNYTRRISCCMGCRLKPVIFTRLTRMKFQKGRICKPSFGYMSHIKTGPWEVKRFHCIKLVINGTYLLKNTSSRFFFFPLKQFQKKWKEWGTTTRAVSEAFWSMISYIPIEEECDYYLRSHVTESSSLPGHVIRIWGLNASNPKISNFYCSCLV